MTPATGFIDKAAAAALGFPQLSYVGVECERKWLCRGVPTGRVRHAVHITDVYVEAAKLRLREAIPLGGGAPRRRLSRKADLDGAHRLMTSIYLSQEEFALFAGLPGRKLVKTRHYLDRVNGIDLVVDEFEGHLAGLFLAEAEFDDEASMSAYMPPDFAVREVTDDPRYRGGSLVVDGIPEEAEVRP